MCLFHPRFACNSITHFPSLPLRPSLPSTATHPPNARTPSGGVLHGGCVQEEIRFVLSPECLVSLLLCDRMSCDEAILIRGTETFSRYSGYNGSFRFAGPYADSAPVKYTSANTSSNVSGSGPGLGHRESLLVAFDATRFALGKQALSQFNTNAVLRFASSWGAPASCSSLSLAFLTSLPPSPFPLPPRHLNSHVRTEICASATPPWPAGRGRRRASTRVRRRRPSRRLWAV